MSSERAARAALAAAGAQAALATVLSETTDAAVRECVPAVAAALERGMKVRSLRHMLLRSCIFCICICICIYLYFVSV